MPRRKAQACSTTLPSSINTQVRDSNLTHENQAEIERNAQSGIDIDMGDSGDGEDYPGVCLYELARWSGQEAVNQDAAALDLARRLHGSPLALQFAGLYIKNTSVTFQQYLDYLEIFSDTFKAVDAVDRQLFSIFQISFDKIDQERSPSGESPAGRLLRLWAYFDRRDLWYDLLNYNTALVPDWLDFPQWLRELVDRKEVFDGAMHLLQSYGFVKPNPIDIDEEESPGYSIDESVQRWIVNVLNEELFLHQPYQESDFARIAFPLLAFHTPHDQDTSDWFRRGQRLVKHAERYLEFHDKIVGNLPACIAWYNDLGRLFTAQDMPEEAMIMMRRAVLVLEAASQLNDRQACIALHNLGLACIDFGLLDEAEGYMTRALDLATELFSENDETTIDNQMQLARVYAKQGKFGQAEPLFNKSIANIRTIPDANPKLAMYAMNSLGCMYIDDHQYEKAIAVLNETRDLIAATPVMWHEVTAVYAARNLSLAYRGLSRYDDAEKVLEWGLTRAKEIWPEEHPSVTTMVFKLAQAYKDQGKITMAQSLFEQFVEAVDKNGSDDEREYFAGLVILSRIYWDSGRHAEAQYLFHYSLGIHSEGGVELCEEDFSQLEELMREDETRYTRTNMRPKRHGKRALSPAVEDHQEPSSGSKHRKGRRR